MLGIIVAAIYPVVSGGRGKLASSGVAILLVLVCVAGGVSMFQPHFVVADTVPDRSLTPSAKEPSSEWLAYGNSAHGTRFADLN